MINENMNNLTDIHSIIKVYEELCLQEVYMIVFSVHIICIKWRKKLFDRFSMEVWASIISL